MNFTSRLTQIRGCWWSGSTCHPWTYLLHRLDLVESSGIWSASLMDDAARWIWTLLDELHGKGGSPTATSAPTPPPAPAAPQWLLTVVILLMTNLKVGQMNLVRVGPTAASSTPPPPPPPAAPVSAMSEGDDWWRTKGSRGLLISYMVQVMVRRLKSWMLQLSLLM